MRVLDAFFGHAGSPWAVGVVTAVLLVLALALNQFVPANRRSLRRVLYWWALYLASALVHTLASGHVSPGLGRFIDGATDLTLAFTVVALVATSVFDLLLPMLGLEVVRITSDLLTGAAYGLAALGVLSVAGLDLGSALAASTVVAAVLTISLQSTLGNVVGGIALQVEGSVKVGDWIQVDGGKGGRVAEIRWRHTVLETRDWDTVIVPNAALLASQFTILGRREGRDVPHRQWVHFHVDFRYAPSQVCEAVQTALRASPIPNVAGAPPPDCICMDLGRDLRESFAIYAVRYWIEDVAQDDPTSSVIRGRVHASLRRAGIPLARPATTQFHIEQGPEAEEARRNRRRARALATLRAVDLFQPLTDEELEHLAPHLVYSPFDKGETITRQGAIAHWLYLIQSGTAEVVTEVEGAPARVVSRLEAPSFFGEMGLMTGEPRLASIIAVTPVVCHRLDKGAFNEVLKQRPALAQGLAETLAKRRVELLAVRENLDQEAQAARERSEQQRILLRIREFFGIDG